MTARAFITGLEGLTLSPDERAFLRDARPWGLIIFKRNVSTPDQVTELTQSFRDAVGSEAPVLVDQEGGRVQRLGPPHWPTYPPGARYSDLYDQEPAAGIAAARLAGHLIAADLRPLGIDVDCLPIADVPVDGRATKDSHHKLPVVDTDRATLEAADFAAFKPLAGLPLGMTAHVVFSAIDPVAPATTSVTMVRQVIRGFIGFQGLLMSDDISMNALSGSIAERSRAALAAGCDVVLHCNGNLGEMVAVAKEAPEFTGAAARRADVALAARKAPEEFDTEAARRLFTQMIDDERTEFRRKIGS
jgi:beta-N-acetylhexosaminidase